MYSPVALPTRSSGPSVNPVSSTVVSTPTPPKAPLSVPLSGSPVGALHTRAMDSAPRAAVAVFHPNSGPPDRCSWRGRHLGGRSGFLGTCADAAGGWALGSLSALSRARSVGFRLASRWSRIAGEEEAHPIAQSAATQR